MWQEELAGARPGRVKFASEAADTSATGPAHERLPGGRDPGGGRRRNPGRGNPPTSPPPYPLPVVLGNVLEGRQLLSYFSLGKSEYLVADRSGAVTVEVYRGGDLQPETVTVSAADADPKDGVAFAPASRTVTFAAGEATQTVDIPLRHDRPVNGQATVRLTLTVPPGSGQLSPTRSPRRSSTSSAVPT